MITANHSLRGFNTFGLDVKAAFFAEVHSPDELRALMKEPVYRKGPVLVLGGGSNILFSKDYPGLVIRNCIEGIDITRENGSSVIRAGGGTVWHELVMTAITNDLGGIENLSLIPGSVGAAPIQNIGAYGVEIKDTFHSLTAIDLQSGEEKVFTGSECGFGYRDSIFKREAKGKYMISSVSFRLTTKDHVLNTSYGAIGQELEAKGITSPSIRDVSNAVISIRRSKLPDPAVIGNAGSFFKNPVVTAGVYNALKDTYPEIVAYPSGENYKLAAGWLIEQCGWKGKRIGETGMHEKQALVLVNYGNATCEELTAHARRVQASVKEKFGVDIEMEVNII